MRYVSLFSGIEAASVAWEPLGWEPVAFSEVEPFCCALLEKRYPDVPNLGDVSRVDWSGYAGSVDVVVGGSPCQAFSVAGKRRGLMDERGQLMLEYVRAVRDLRPKWALWENVPGALSQDGGRAFGTLLRELEDCGYSLAWRVLDAQFAGVAQRRRRVFLVGHARVGCAAAVLFERESLRWDTATSRDKRQELAADSGRGAEVGCLSVLGNVVDREAGCNGLGISEDLAPTLNTIDRHAVAVDCRNVSLKGEVSGTLLSKGQGGYSLNYQNPVLAFAQNSRDEVRVVNGNGQISGALTAQPGAKQTTFVCVGDQCDDVVAFSAGNTAASGSVGAQIGVSPTLRASSSGTNQVPAICFNHNASGRMGFGEAEELSPTLRVGGRSSGNMSPAVCMASANANAEIGDDLGTCLTAHAAKDAPIVSSGYVLRRLTPIECERLQGFPDGWTDIFPVDLESVDVDGLVDAWDVWDEMHRDLETGKRSHHSRKKVKKWLSQRSTSDAPRYAALGNSMAVPMMRWIGERLDMVEEVSLCLGE